jgi:hypothetical protein
VNGSTKRNPDYKVVYRKAVEFSFQALGGQVSKVVANYISRKYEMTIEETYSSPESLAEALEGTLGAGALLIERRIVKSIYAQLSLPLSDPSIRLKTRQDFGRYIAESRELSRQTDG